MDAGRKSDRMFPGYTTEQLKVFLAQHIALNGPNSRVQAERIKTEIDRRENGLSKAFFVPQASERTKRGLLPRPWLEAMLMSPKGERT